MAHCSYQNYFSYSLKKPQPSLQSMFLFAVILIPNSQALTLLSVTSLLCRWVTSDKPLKLQQIKLNLLHPENALVAFVDKTKLCFIFLINYFVLISDISDHWQSAVLDKSSAFIITDLMWIPSSRWNLSGYTQASIFRQNGVRGWYTAADQLDNAENISIRISWTAYFSVDP